MATQNIRVFRNLCINHAHASLSSQPVYGGPAYFIRNIVYHAPERGAIKMYMSPAGVIFYHNTLLAEVNVGQASVHTGASNLHFRNNLILGENPESQKNYVPDDFRGIFYMDTYTSYTTSDYNGFRITTDSVPMKDRICSSRGTPRVAALGQTMGIRGRCTHLERLKSFAMRQARNAMGYWWITTYFGT
jgi:hypothetical protein